MKGEQLVNKKNTVWFTMHKYMYFDLLFEWVCAYKTKLKLSDPLKKTSFVFKYFLIHFISAMLRDFILGFNP